MPLFFCTPRGDVYPAPPLGQSLRYTEKHIGNDGWRTRVYEHQHAKAWGVLPMRHARDIYEARVDFMFDQATKDTLEDIRRMFRYATSDRLALERHRQREEYRQKHGW